SPFRRYLVVLVLIGCFCLLQIIYKSGQHASSVVADSTSQEPKREWGWKPYESSGKDDTLERVERVADAAHRSRVGYEFGEIFRDLRSKPNNIPQPDRIPGSEQRATAL